MMSAESASMNRFEYELNEEHKGILGEWIEKYKKSYPVVGELKRKSVPPHTNPQASAPKTTKT